MQCPIIFAFVHWWEHKEISLKGGSEQTLHEGFTKPVLLQSSRKYKSLQFLHVECGTASDCFKGTWVWIKDCVDRAGRHCSSHTNYRSLPAILYSWLQALCRCRDCLKPHLSYSGHKKCEPRIGIIWHAVFSNKCKTRWVRSYNQNLISISSPLIMHHIGSLSSSNGNSATHKHYCD